MSGESTEGVSAEAGLGDGAVPEGDLPRAPRTVPRPTPATAIQVPAPRKPAADGFDGSPPVAVIDAALAAVDEGDRRSDVPSSDGPGSGPDGAGHPRRRSRRTVKIPDDAVPHKAAPPPSIEVVAAPPPPVEAPVSERPPLPVIPPSPPVPVLSPRAPEAPRPAPVEMFEVIQPMRIISIGSQPPAAPLVTAAPEIDTTSGLDDAGWDQPERSPSRPPLPALPEIEQSAAPEIPKAPAVPALAAEAPKRPKPPVVEEVEAISEEEPEAHDATAAPTLRTEEIESIPDDEIEPTDRISDVSVETAAAPEEIAVEAIEAPPATKKPPPPPPKRQAAPDSLDRPTPPSTPIPTAPVAARPAEPPPAPPPPPPPAAPPERPLAQTIELPTGRKRQKPWWEEIFSDDYLRTMEKIEPKIIRKECDFIEDRLGLEKGAIMLDLACGAGTHAVELSSRGYNVVGYDLSLAMLARAQDEALDRGQRINFLQGDVREMAFEEAFDGIYCWNTSFGYFEDEKNLDVLVRIRRALRQGGMFLLDVANRDYICPRQPSLVWFEGEGCVCMDEMFVDFFTARLRVKRTVMFEDGRAKECDYGIRLYGLHELGKMLHETGFKVVEVTGHPAHPGVFFGSESPRIIILAERA